MFSIELVRALVDSAWKGLKFFKTELLNSRRLNLHIWEAEPTCFHWIDLIEVCWTATGVQLLFTEKVDPQIDIQNIQLVPQLHDAFIRQTQQNYLPSESAIVKERTILTELFKVVFENLIREACCRVGSWQWNYVPAGASCEKERFCLLLRWLPLKCRQNPSITPLFMEWEMFLIKLACKQKFSALRWCKRIRSFV